MTTLPAGAPGTRPLRRFLAATDGSPHGDRAVSMANILAQKVRGQATRVSLPPNGRGLPGVEIVRHADRWSADLVLLGRPEVSAAWPRSLGSTSDNVLRRFSGPTLFVPRDAQPPERAVIALDGSLRGIGVIGLAMEFLKLTTATATAVCVIPGERQGAADELSLSDFRTERVAAAVEGLALASGPVQVQVRRGGPVAELLGALEETGANLLILGVRRGGKAGDAGSGYVGRELLRSAPCAVLTVPI